MVFQYSGVMSVWPSTGSLGLMVGTYSGTWYLNRGFQKPVALLQACPAEPKSTGGRCEPLALQGALCVRERLGCE